MKYPRKSFLMVLLIAVAAFNAASATPSSSQGGGSYLAYGEEDDVPEATSLRTALTCNKYPRICRAKGSPGPDCCNKKCVNVSTDRLNCGMCGHKCRYSEICCQGQCVNAMFDKKHCGGCNNKCKRKNSACVYGMCSYA
ncbi:hypothetical protein EUGRSUZ_E04009 [Eucalyptus grandis]|uniref:Uncharacterized protein n=2 Tax=Eucalyptus grandis TaxID=71139 RepID=A0ACC3L0D4_EUCGR|nr:hypothetical protein EUGRSUZ_E04009 [Eucalyptus grandis]